MRTSHLSLRAVHPRGEAVLPFALACMRARGPLLERSIASFANEFVSQLLETSTPDKPIGAPQIGSERTPPEHAVEQLDAVSTSEATSSLPVPMCGAPTIEGPPTSRGARADTSAIAMQIARFEVALRNGDARVGGESLALGWRDKDRGGNRVDIVVHRPRPGEVTIDVRGTGGIDLAALARQLDECGIRVVQS